MGPGFEEFFERYDGWPWREAQEYRQRHLIRALTRKGGGLGG